MNQKGIAQIVVVLIILAGLALGVYLIGQKTFFKPKAGLEGTRIEFAGSNVAGDKTTSRNVKLKAYFVPPTVSAPVGGTYPTPSGYGTPGYSTPSGATTVRTVTYELFAGDNFIGLPFDYTFTSYTPARLLSDTGGKCDAIWTTYANEGKMLVYPAGTKVTDYFTGTEVPDSKKGVIGNLAGGNGYFIRCSGSTTMTITAKPLSVDEAFRLSGYQKDSNYPAYVAAPFNNQNLGASRVKTLDLLNKLSRGSLNCTEVLTPRVICTTSGEACSISGTTSYVKGGYSNFTLRDDTGYAVICSAKPTSVSAPVYTTPPSYQTPESSVPSVQGATTGSYTTPPAGGTYPTQFRVASDTAGLSSASEHEFRGNPTEIDWVLTAGNGTKTVYAEFKLNGVWGNRVSASITLAEPSVSGPVTTPTGFGKAASFRGTTINPQYIDVSSSNVLDPSVNFTIEAWVKPVTSSGSLYTQIVSKSGPRNSYELSYNSESQTGGTVRYYYTFALANQGIDCGYVTASSLNGTVNDSSGRPINGHTVDVSQVATWKNVTGVARNGNLYIYENGKLVAKNEFGIRTTCKSDGPLRIGAGSYSDKNPRNFFQGEVDEVRISKNARYSSNFTPQLTPFSVDRDTVALYHLDGNGKDATGGTEGIIYSPIQFNFVDSTIGAVLPSPTPTVSPTTTPRPTATPTLRPSPTPTLRPSPTPTPTPTAQPVACSACGADINKDGVVNMQDFSRLSSCFNRRSTDTVAGVACANADLNGDRVVTIVDYSCLASKFNQRCEANLTTQPKVSTQVVSNNPPTITSSVDKGFFTRIVITARDVDRDNINVTISGKPANSYGPYCFGSNGVRTCYIYTRAGSGTITATASDGKGGTATTTINVLR